MERRRVAAPSKLCDLQRNVVLIGVLFINYYAIGRLKKIRYWIIEILLGPTLGRY